MSDTLKTNVHEELREVAQGKPELTINTLGELLEAAKEHPEVLERAHQKVWRVISSPITINVGGKNPEILYPEILSELKGITEQRKYHDQPSELMRYPLFASLLGIDPGLAQSAVFFKDASGKVKTPEDSEDKILELVSSRPGCGKTTIRKIIERALRKESFFFLKDCPHRENPLHAIPFEERVGILNGLCHPDAELCVRCEKKLQQKELGGEWKNFPVQSTYYRPSAGIGIAQVENGLPTPRNSGEIPNAWNRIFNHANGGILFINLPEQPKELCSMLSGLVTDGTLKDRDQTEWWPDMAIVSISNKKLSEVEQPDRALIDRVVSVPLRMVLDPDAELKIQQRVAHNRGLHVVPGVLLAFSRPVAASRLDAKKSYSSGSHLESKEALMFYGGGARLTSDKKNLFSYSYKELTARRPDDGADGITRREVVQLLTSAGQYSSCVGIQHLISALKDAGLDKKHSGDVLVRIKEWLSLEQDEKQEAAMMEKLYRDKLEKDLIRGLIGKEKFGEVVAGHFEKYLTHAAAYVDPKKTKPKDDQGKDVDIDEFFLKKVEEQVSIYGGSEGDNFRSCVATFFKGPPPHNLGDHPPLEKAILKMVTDEYRGQVRIALSPNPADPMRAKKHLENMKSGLLKLGYYKECCWLTVLSYAPRMFKT